MISGLLKLFYSEVVKSRIKDMTKKEYTIKEHPIQQVSAKVDDVLGRSLKYFTVVVGILIAFNLSVLFGIGSMAILMLYTYYKVFLEENFKENIKENVGVIKSNIEGTSQRIVTDNIKPKINALIIILLIGLFTDFNVVSILCFITVFIFTIKDLYSNIKNIR